MVNLILGLSGTGKTTKIKDEMKIKAENGEKILYIVPERMSFFSEQTFFNEFSTKAYHNIEILSFNRLCNFIFRELGGLSKNVYRKEEKLLKVFFSIKKNKNHLNVYKNQVGKEPFAYKMLDLIKEFKSLSIYEDDLMDIVDENSNDSLKQKLKEILLIYSDYQNSLDDDYVDGDDDIKRATDLIRGMDYFKDYHIYLDNFVFFSNSEYELIKEILLKNKSFTITLKINKLDNNTIYLKGVENTAKKIINISKETNNTISKITLENLVRYNNTYLKELNRYLSDGEPISSNGCLDVYNGQNKYETLKYVSSYIQDLVKNKKYNGEYRYKDICVVTREYDEYKLPLKKFFNDYNIPYFLDEDNSILDKPIISLIYNILKILTTNFNSTFVINYMQSPFLDIDEEDVFLFLDYLYVFNIEQNMFYSEFKNNPSGFKPEFSESEKEKLKVIENTRKKYIEPLIELKKELHNKNAKDIVKIIYDFIIKFNINERLEEVTFLIDKKINVSEMWNILIDVLDIIHTSSSDDSVTLKEFCEIFLLVCKSYSVKKIPQRQDEVMFSDISNIFFTNPKVVIFLGANYGSFPKHSSNNTLLSNMDRKHFNENKNIINEENAKVIDEYHYCYNALTASSDKVLLTYDSFKINGENLLKSYLLSEIVNESNIKVSTKKEVSNDYYIYDNNTAFLTFCDIYDNTGEFKESLKEFLHSTKEYENYIDSIAFYIEPSKYFLKNKEAIDLVYNKDLNFSVTQLDKIRNCRFSHFLSNGLKMYKTRKAEISYGDIGELVHFISEHIIKRFDGTFLKRTKDELFKEVEKIGLHFITTRYGKNKLPYDYEYLLETIKKDSKELVLQIQKELNFGEYKIYGTEVVFGKNTDIKGYNKTIDGRTISINGIIDRVDVYEDNDNAYVRVIDYKTSNKEFNYGSFYEGIDMQLLIYLFSLKNSFINEKPIVLSGAFYMPSRIENTDIKSVKKTIDDNFKFSGVLQSGIDIEKSIGGKGNPYIKDCLKTGLLTSEEFSYFNNHIDNILDDTILNINNGDIRSIPMVHKDTTPCKFCDYKFVCKFESNNNEVREKASLDKNKILKKLLGENDEK